MGKRKERRQLQTSGRRMKLDLSSDDVVGSDEIPRTTPDLVAENPLSLLGQYSDDETDKEEELAEKFTSLPSTKSPDQQGNAEASPLANEICQINIEIEQNGGEQNFSCSSKNEAVENDWKAVFDENSGQYYYWNLRTGETTWKMPVLGELVKVDDHSVAEGESVCVIDSSKAANVVDVQDAQDNRLSSHSLDNLIEHTEKVASHREILSEFGLNAEINKVSHAEDLLENSQCVRNSDGNLDSDSHFPSNSNVEIVSKPDDKSCDNAGSETAIVKIADKDEETVQTIEEGLTLEVDRTIEDFRESKCRDPSNVSESMIVTNVCHEAPVLDARSTLEEGSALLAEREESIQQKLKKLAGNSIEKPSNHALMAIRLEIQLGVWKAFCGLGFVPEACFSFICSELTKIESILDEEIEYIKKSNISQSRIVDAHNESKLANSLFMGTSTNGSIDNVGGKVQEPASGMLTTDEYVQTSETHNGQICTWYRSSTEVCNYSLDDGLVDTDMEVDMEVDNDGKNEPPVPGIGPDSVVTANSFPVPVSDPLHSSESQFHSAPNNSNIWVPPLPVEEEWAPPLPGETESIPPPPPEEPPPLPLNSLQLQSSYMLGSNVSCVDYYNSEYMTSAAGYIAAPEYQSLAMDSSMYGAYMQEVPGAYALNAIPVETGEIVEPYISDPSSAYLQWTSPFPPKSSVSYPVVSQKPLPSSSTVALSPALCTTSDNMAATTNSEAKKAPKGKPIKKRTHSVASAPMLNKKVSSLVSKWKQAKEELHGGEDEDDKALYDIEVLEKKKQKEIEEWRRQQIASGEALDNANFQPLGAIDWRDRVKKAKKSDATEGDVRENPSVPTQEIEREVRKTDKSIVAEMSRGLPDDWQAFWDEESGEVYYGNLKTKETSWTRPVVKSTELHRNMSTMADGNEPAFLRSDIAVAESEEEEKSHLINLGVPNHMNRLRVLCLHGFRTSGRILQQQLERWDASLHRLLDLTFLDAPFPCRGKSDVEGVFPAPYYEWFQYNIIFTEYTGLEACIEYISNYMYEHGPFDGLLGFSQGAVLSAALAGLQQKNLALSRHPPLRFVILISGAMFKNPEWKQDCYSHPITCPSLHFIGSKDWLKPKNEELVGVFEGPTVVRHGGKHCVPRLDEEATRSAAGFLQRRMVQEEGEEDIGGAPHIRSTMVAVSSSSSLMPSLLSPTHPCSIMMTYHN